MNRPRQMSPTRDGFLILMLIAFTSIILGLATTFYVYCQRGMENSQVAVRIAQQRLALNAAMSYVVGQGLLYTAPPITSVFAVPSDAATLFVMQDPTIPRTKSLGWFRVAAANSTYVTANFMGAPYNVTDAGNCAFVTAGAGRLAGQKVTKDDIALWNDTALWQYELRSWYLVELLAPADPTPPLGNRVKRLVKLPGPPQTGTGATTVFYW